MKSRMDYLCWDNLSSKFLQTTAMCRRNKNKISYLKDKLGNWVTDPSLIKHIFKSYFANLFTTDFTSNYLEPEPFPIPLPNLKLEPLRSLALKPTPQEIKKALFELKPFKSPRPDGLHPYFFQKFWIKPHLPSLN